MRREDSDVITSELHDSLGLSEGRTDRECLNHSGGHKSAFHTAQERPETRTNPPGRFSSRRDKAGREHVDASTPKSVRFATYDVTEGFLAFLLTDFRGHVGCEEGKTRFSRFGQRERFPNDMEGLVLYIT